ncbi:TetR/AcrR family transcriptional regulator [Mycobacterium terramassiliense]|uniref:TetR family transcriptional regulator n=1 Tax=Mycobacterium terramassiliense TaxID=1841859 RepID=A0A2U3NG86_9MYCO|nr:TetR/AcrR family transcriptional regulator [Mycobacterium terramassiliense]SPM30561.1 TetR family transcriptional regulator [Mycobacterium terramassiliense]
MSDVRTGVRRPAVQARSRATIERILVAAGYTFDEVGLEAATMEAIAERAGSSIGAVYRFFGEKQSLVTTLAQRCEQRSTEMFADLFSADSLRRSSDVVIAEFIANLQRLLDEIPGARAIMAAMLVGPAVEQMWMAHVERFIVNYAPRLSKSRRRVAAHTYHTITLALLASPIPPGASLSKHLQEARTVLTGYIQALADESLRAGTAAEVRRR